MANKPRILDRAETRVALWIVAMAVCGATWCVLGKEKAIVGVGGGHSVDMRVQRLERTLEERVRKGANTIADLLGGLDEFLDSTGNGLRLVVSSTAITIEIPGRDGVWGTADDEFQRVERSRR